MRETEKGENGAQGEDESQSSESEGDGAEVGHGHHHLKQEVPSQSCSHTLFIYTCWNVGMEQPVKYCTFMTLQWLVAFHS